MQNERPLALIHSEPLLDTLLQLAAAAGCELMCAPDAMATRRREWQAAPLVLLDEHTARECAEAGLPRRPGVIVLATGDPPEPLWQQAVEIGAEQVISLPAKETWLINALADATDRPAPTAGRVLAVLGGRGGAGASVLSAALALTATKRGSPALLIDCDPLAAGLDQLLGAEGEPGLRWPDLHVGGGRVTASALRAALPGRAAGGPGFAVLSCDRTGNGPDQEALAAVIDAGRRAGDTVICDLPRQVSPVTDVATDRADLAVLVVPAEIRASTGGRLIASRLRERGTRVGVVVRGPAPSRLRAQEIAEAVNAPLLAALRSDVRLPANVDRGIFATRLSRNLRTTADTVLDAITPQLTQPIGGTS